MKPVLLLTVASLFLWGCHGGPAMTSGATATSQYNASTPAQKALMAVNAPIPTTARINEINSISGLSAADKQKYISMVH